MSLSSILATAQSGLMAAQTSLRTVSDNVSNVNTPGYVRKQANQQQLVVEGVGMGVQITGIQRVTDQYLQAASLTASSGASQWSAISQYLDNAQSLFGNPSSTSSFFNQPGEIFAAFASAADNPSSTLQRTQAISTVQDFLGEANRINTQIASLSKTVDGQMSDDVSQANSLLSQIDSLNVDITRARLANADSSGSENIQSNLVDQLSALMGVRVVARPAGGVTVRSPEGVMLAGDGAATLTYNRTPSTGGYITAQTAGGGAPQAITVNGGEVRGLLDLRNTTLPGLSDQLGEFVGRAAEQINAAHNASTAFPPPASLTGRDTGLDVATAVDHFSGQTTVAIVNASGVVQKQVAIDFTAGTMSINSGPATAFTPATFLSTLNSSLGAQGAASFSNGALSISASGSNGVAIDEGTSMKAGKAFSSFFGLNDLVQSGAFGTYDTGLQASDPNGFTPGDQLVLRLAGSDGNPIRDVTITVPPAASPTMGDLVNALNNNTTGVGLYGQFSLDAKGALSFTGSAPADATVAVVQDNTARGVGGPSVSALFGIGVTPRSARAGTFSVNPAIAADPTLLALGKLDLSVAAGTPAISAGDGRGALALSQAGNATTLFQAAGSLGQVSMTVSEYAAQFGGSIGRDAASASSKATNAASVQTEANTRRASVEGVNINEELVNMQTYQQAFSASARMIQASKDLFDTLLNMI